MSLGLKFFYKIVFWISLLGLLVVILDFGFSQTDFSQLLSDTFYFVVLGSGLISTFFRYYRDLALLKRKAFIFDFLSVVFTLWLFYLFVFVGVPFETDLILENDIWVKIAVLFTFIREFSELKINFKRSFLSPPQLFITSFLLIIFLGSLLLLLPKATFNGISYLDALFTATSAVCVTGLIVVDTGNYFTLFGQTILMILIQIGGLGILTFASYFS